MAKIETLKENRDFRRLYGRGRSFPHPALVTYAMKNRAGCSRIGITASKKLGGAVQRNRARRIIAAAYRELAPALNGSYDFVFVARARTLRLKSTDVLRVMRAHLRAFGALD